MAAGANLSCQGILNPPMIDPPQEGLPAYDRRKTMTFIAFPDHNFHAKYAEKTTILTPSRQARKELIVFIFKNTLCAFATLREIVFVFQALGVNH